MNIEKEKISKKMKGFESVVKEINHTLDFLLFFPVFLNSAIIFLGMYFLFSLLDENPLWGLLPMVMYLVLSITRRLLIDKITLVEKEYPFLKEKLSTAADVANQEGFIVEQLHDEVKHELKSVATSSFINTKQITGKIMTAIILAFSVLIINSSLVDTADFKDSMQDLISTLEDELGIVDGLDQLAILGEGEGDKAGSGLGGDIIGEEYVAELGGKEFEFEIRQTPLEVNIDEISDPEEKQFRELFPEDTSLEQTRTFDEEISKENQEIVKSYFTKLNEN